MQNKRSPALSKMHDFPVPKTKCVFVGEQNSGKTCIILRFIHDIFDPTYHATIGIDFLSKTVCVGQKAVRLQIWDTAGQERFKSLVPSYIRDSEVAIVVYDITSRKSFDKTTGWIKHIREERSDKSIVFLVGNKTDLEGQRVVTTEEGEKLAQMENVIFFETSAKANKGINLLFKRVAEEILKRDWLMTSANKLSFEDQEPSLKKKWRCRCF
ncbi:unnamed protein product [Calicophoron daubneyi]|uniref:Uncharacterized protein n=1 Tax=Calicophoron daubneyi TaxID=300641 RepID=A0AAV2U064_CALDB